MCGVVVRRQHAEENLIYSKQDYQKAQLNGNTKNLTMAMKKTDKTKPDYDYENLTWTTREKPDNG